MNGAPFHVGGLSGAGNLTFASGTYGLGDSINTTGIGLTGTLGVGQANVSLVDTDGVDLGSLTTLASGTLGSLTGFKLESNDQISGSSVGIA